METNAQGSGQLNPEIVKAPISRREAMRRGAAAAAVAGLRLASVPAAFGIMPTHLYAQSPSDILDALQFAFILENLENEFYRAVLNLSDVSAQNSAFTTVRAQLNGAPDSVAILAALRQIQRHEQQHVDFLRNTAIPLFGGTPPAITGADFDFTGGNGTGAGPFARATTELEFLLLTAQALEDTGVRAYKGQAARFMVSASANADVALESALRIHAVEARHSAKIRRVRRLRNPGESVLRLSGQVRGGGSAAAGASVITNVPAQAVTLLGAIYGGATPEDNTQHVFFNDVTSRTVTVDAATMSGLGGFTFVGGESQFDAAAMAFDEPLTKAEVLGIVQNFIINDATRGLP